MVGKPVSPAEVVEKSGHNLHSRVVTLLRREGWSVIVSPYYSDNFTDKPREIDIIAEKSFPYDYPGPGLHGEVAVQLFIECKYIASTTVIWFDSKDTDRAADRVRMDTGWSDPRNTHPYLLKHHHLQDTSVAKLFASSGSRNEDGEALGRAINQNLNALIYYRSRGLFSKPVGRRERLGPLRYPPHRGELTR